MAKALQRMLAAEDKKRIFKTIDMYVHPRGDGNLNYIEIPDPPTANPKNKDTQWKRIDDIDEMNRVLTLHNRSHFHQVQGTPFTTSPLLDILQHHGMTTAGEAILNGSFDTSPYDTPTQTLLKSMKR